MWIYFSNITTYNINLYEQTTLKIKHKQKAVCHITIALYHEIIIKTNTLHISKNS